MKIQRITRIGLFFLVCCLGFFSKTSTGIFAGKEADTKLHQYSPQSESQTATTAAEDIAEAYREYQQTFEKLKTAEDIQKAGYKLLEEQQFFIGLGTFGKQDVCFLPAMDQRYHRLAVFILDKDRRILYKTNELENNSIRRGQLEQPETEMVAVTFQDLNHDGLTDIGFITQYKAERTYKIGDVLFQSEGGFYRDYRISDKMNRFGMNKNINCMASFVRDGCRWCREQQSWWETIFL